MIFHVVIVSQAFASEIAARQALQRARNGLPPLPAPPPPPPPTFSDRLAGVLFWFLVMLPGIAMAALVGIGLYAIIKFVFAAQGLEFSLFGP